MPPLSTLLFDLQTALESCLPLGMEHCLQDNLNSPEGEDGRLQSGLLAAQVPDDAGREHDHVLVGLVQKLQDVADVRIVRVLKMKDFLFIFLKKECFFVFFSDLVSKFAELHLAKKSDPKYQY